MVVNVRAMRPVRLGDIRVTTRVVKDRELPPAPPITVECESDGARADIQELILSWSGETTTFERDDSRPLPPGESDSFMVKVSISHASGSAFYVLDVGYTVDGVAPSQVIDDNGRPFYLTWGMSSMNYGPPTYTFVPGPRPRFTHRPAICSLAPGEHEICPFATNLLEQRDASKVVIGSRPHPSSGRKVDTVHPSPSHDSRSPPSLRRGSPGNRAVERGRVAGQAEP
ncbi:hypothetical protein [Herbidospora mongoliensis]|uniref:hypothetical protein n=1 Tax=Herbidospora mongoliensis TaxID=688067 RepID=UPI000830E194|nr:hypothetical protein [Herbidospora mongoliensis]